MQNPSQNPFFNTKQLKEQGNDMLDMIGELYDNLENVHVQPNLKPGFLRDQLPFEPPQTQGDMNQILSETREKLFPGITQWQHPAFFAYYPSTVSHMTILADMFAQAFNSPGFIFNVSPTHTELENIVMDWLAQLIGLPEVFLLKNQGGGSMQTSISDAMFNTVHAAKKCKMQELNIKPDNPDMLKFVGYYVEHGFAASQKSLMLKDIAHQRQIPIIFDERVQNFQPDVKKFEQMLEEDVKNGLIPFWVGITYGTTATGAIDPINEMVKISKKYNAWVNLDAAYASFQWLWEEKRIERGNLENVDSILINAAKAFMVGMNGAIIYVNDKKKYQSQFSMNPMEIYKNQNSQREDCIDYSNWYVGFGRRFNAMKLYYIIKAYGKQGLEQNVKEKIELAHYFKNLIDKSDKFTIFAKPCAGLITFRYTGDYKTEEELKNNLQEINEKNQKLLELIREDTQKGYISPSMFNNTYLLRLVVCNPNTTEKHIDIFWEFLNEKAKQL
ncbi:Pyridoxal phosphate-dependent transferase [Pseudocohnilembus persalinus]|uniref:Pyridoxal phosphate-dependent transferase n=1 Tax=Pseudocohnilembus persalinus TaxID=266149 RepID=A0A0V0R9C2_PSEPJ|nr:Pyridoxal phosphate-dependent transferase [Pseudocohnilembus persalinus]|eukprot:KRX11095.1 Pyridoxal phosphate-dependent transferase [Pseudocohnilembus persalinus]